MPQIEIWENLPEAVQRHLIDRMHDRAISVSDLNQRRRWIKTRPQVPEGDWYKDFGSFKLCGSGSYPKTFLLQGQMAKPAFRAPSRELRLNKNAASVTYPVRSRVI